MLPKLGVTAVLMLLTACSSDSTKGAPDTEAEKAGDRALPTSINRVQRNQSVPAQTLGADQRAAGDDTRSQASVPTVPTRFHGLYALDRKACAEDYTYNPAFQNVTVTAGEVSFFETGGPVTAVEVEGDNVAITLREVIGDGTFERVIYLALNADGTARYRPGGDAPVQTYVRCAKT